MNETINKKSKKHHPGIEKTLARRAMEELERRKCREDTFYFATHYCYTLDSDDADITNKLFPKFAYLKKLFTLLQKRNDLHIEKSRQMLVSWSVMIFLLHQVLFKKNRQMLVVSSKQENVDDGGSNSTPQSLLGKARYCYSQLPSFLKQTAGEGEILSFKNLLINNIALSSSIKGESSSSNAGRGGNYHYALLDEAAFIPNSESVYASTRLACKKGLIICSTPNGKGNIHWRIKYGSTETGFSYLRLHWSDHPLRDKKWYDQRCKSMTDIEIARELNIDYEGSIAGKVYTEFDHVRHIARYRLLFNPDMPLYTTWDFGIGDPTAILFLQTDMDGKILVIDEYEDSGKDSSFYAGKTIQIVESWGFSCDAAKKIIKNAKHYGDPSGASRGPRLESWIGDLNQRLGIYIQTKKGVLKMEKINRVKFLLKAGRVLISPHCAHFIEALQNYLLETDKSGKISGERPMHNWASHINDAFQEFCINRFPRSSNKVEAFRIDI
jgi:hypothetical protein